MENSADTHVKSRTERLAKGRRYPLRPSVLEAAVADAGLELPITLTRLAKEREHLFEATFYPAGSLSPERIWVACGAAPSENAAEIRASLEADAVPRFIQWAKEIEKLDAKSTRRRMMSFQFSWDPSRAAV